MQGFKNYFGKEEQEDVSKTLAKLPRSHQELARQFKLGFEGGNTLKGDDGHVGMVTNKPEPHIKVSAPYYNTREHVFLHELAHLIIEKWVKDTPLEQQWAEIVARTPMKKKDRDTPEEYLAHAYATYYSKNRLSKFDIPEWMEFVKKLPS